MADDNPFAGLMTPPSEDFREPPAAPDVNPFAHLMDTSLPQVAPESPTRTIDVLARPGIAFKALGDYVNQRAASAQLHGSSTGVLSSLAGDALQQAQDIERAKAAGITDPKAFAAQEHARRVADERAAAPRDAKTIPEQIAGFLGDVKGTILAPESMIGLPEKAISIAGRPIVSGILRHAAGGAIGNTAADLAAQGGGVARGYQEGFNPFEALMAPVVGAAAGGTLGAVGHGAKFAGDTAAGVRALHTEPSLLNGGDVGVGPGQNINPFAAAPATVDSLWGGLLHQEHGVDQDGKPLTSPKGARGIAQLMPDTAAEVAGRLGRPELAQIALGDGPMANIANEILGKAYLNEQLHAFGGDPVLALAAYNAGPGKVREWIKTYGHPDEIGRARWLAMIPYEETRNYVLGNPAAMAGNAHVLTPEEAAYVQARTPQPAPAEAAVPPVSRADTAAAAAAEAAKAHAEAMPPEQPQPTGEVRTAMPWDDVGIPGEKSPSPSPKEIPEGQDLTDQALNQLRSGEKLTMGEGPSLIEALVKAGGIKDADGELANLLGGAGDTRLQKMLRRVNTGMDLDAAALWAQEHGYIGRPDLEERASPAVLLEAIRREATGDKVYPSDRINEHAGAIQEHMTDLDEVLQHVGVDLSKTDNATARRMMDEWFHERDRTQPEPGWLGMKDTGEVLGMNPREAMATGAAAVQNAQAAHMRAALRNEVMESTRGGGALRGARSFQGVPAPRDAAGNIDLSVVDAVRSVPDIIRTLADALGYPVRQGRISMRNALGTYNRRSGMVRTKGRYDINVLAHEFGHALEFTDGHALPNVIAAMRAHTAALKRMDYNQGQLHPGTGKPPPGRRHEGFAEWFRWYITNPAYADQIPGGQAFRHDFEAAMAKDDPKGLAAIKAAQAEYQHAMVSHSLAVTAAHVTPPAGTHPLAKLLRLGVEKGPIGAVKEIANEAYRGLIDELHPWKMAVNEVLGRVEEHTGRRPELIAADDPYKLLQSLPNVAARGHADLIFGVHGYHSLDVGSASFSDALRLALGDPKVLGIADRNGLPAPQLFPWSDKDIADFGTYLIGRRALDLYDSVGKVRVNENGRKHGMEAPPDALSREAWATATAEREEAHPQYALAAEMLYDWNNALWKKNRDAGFISDGAYLAGLEDHPHYVPMFRDISDKEFGGSEGGSRGSATEHAGGVVQLKGSDRVYINPLHSMMNMAYELNARIARNDALAALDGIGKMFGPDAGDVVERIPAHELVGTTTTVDEVIENAGRKFGVSPRDAENITDQVREMFGAQGDESLDATVYRAKATGARGEPVAWLWQDGEKIPLRLPDGQWGKHMVESLAGMDHGQRGVFMDLIAAASHAQRAGIVAHPMFWATNTFKDQIMTFLLTDVGYLPLADMLRGLGHEVGSHFGPDELSRIYNSVGGEIGGYVSAGAHEAATKKDLQQLKTGWRGSVRHFATWNGLAHFTESSETATRKGLFEKAMASAKARGMSDYDAAIEARHVAQDVMNFSRHGAWPSMRAFARITPFLNASIQGIDKIGRVGVGVGHLPKILAPLFAKAPPATPQEAREFALALKLWLGAGVMAVAGLSLAAAKKEDPEYSELNDQVKATSWSFKTPAGDFALAPKPYETGFLSNVMERAFQRTAMHDPTAWLRLRGDAVANFLPPLVPTAAGLAAGALSNRDGLGAPIVPDYLKTRLPRDQYTDRTSDVAKWLGSHVNGEQGVSPAMLDYLAKGLGGSNIREAVNADHGQAPVAERMPDMPLLGRLVKDWTRGANSTKAFYDLVSQSDGRWAQSVGSLTGLINDGNYKEAISRLKAMDAPERAFVMASVFAHGEHHDEKGRKDADFVKQDHPMIRAEEASKTYAAFARQLADGNVRGPDLKPIEVTPKERSDALHLLRELAVSEQRNGMILAGVEGYKDQAPLPDAKYRHEFAVAAPQLVPALREHLKESHVQDMGLTARNWGASRNMLESPHTEAGLIRMMEAKRFPDRRNGEPTADAMKRAMSDVVPVGQ